MIDANNPIWLWKLCADLTIPQASLLILGINPSDCINSEPVGFHAIFNAVTTAIRNGKLNAILHYNAWEQRGWVNVRDGEQFITCVKTIHYDNSKIVYETEPDWDKTTVNVNDLKAWLLGLNFPAPFFFGEKSSHVPDYLDPNHPRYSAKLAASIKAWQAMDDDNLLLKKTPKKAMESWLENRYKELGLEHNGKINNSAISECAKIANWQTEGGSPSTPTCNLPTP